MRCTPIFGLQPVFLLLSGFFSPLTAVWTVCCGMSCLGDCHWCGDICSQQGSRKLSPVPVCTGCCVNLLRGTEKDEKKTDRQIITRGAETVLIALLILCLCRIAAGDDKSHGAAEFILV